MQQRDSVTGGLAFGLKAKLFGLGLEAQSLNLFEHKGLFA